jgi:hypothetical protein
MNLSRSAGFGEKKVKIRQKLRELAKNSLKGESINSPE